MNKYEKMWSELVTFIQKNEGDKARVIFDELVDAASTWDRAAGRE